MVQWESPLENLAVKGLRRPSPTFWRQRRVLLTGHTGFKGAWLAQWLAQMGANTTGVALPPDSKPNLFYLAQIEQDLDSRLLDIRDPSAMAGAMQEAQPEIVLHLAAQALVRASYQQPLETLSTNVMGTAHVLEAARHCPSVKVVVCVTTDKVYHNREWAYPYRENDRLGGHDPYSASKAACELVVAGYNDAFLKAQGVAVATARAGNVIGGGDWSTDRLIPDAVRAWQNALPLDVRRPGATRPWQHVLEPLAAYLLLAESLWLDAKLSGAWNFGPATEGCATVQTVVEIARQCYGTGSVVYTPNSSHPHEAGNLALDSSRARHALGWQPRWSLHDTVSRTLDWYRRQSEGTCARELCQQDLQDYLA